MTSDGSDLAHVHTMLAAQAFSTIRVSGILAVSGGGVVE